MQTNHARAAVTAAWVLGVGALAYVLGTTSFAGWAVAAMVALVPPALMLRFWRTPSPTMSETIREVTALTARQDKRSGNVP